MINKGFEIQTPLVKVEPDFVNLKVIPSGKNTPASKRKYRVIFKFKVYVNLFEALLQGITRFEMVVTEKDRFTIPFFTNPSNATPESVSNDVRAFFTKSKRALRVQAKRQVIYSKTYNIMDFADDRMISKISTGVVTLNNYERFHILPNRCCYFIF